MRVLITGSSGRIGNAIANRAVHFHTLVGVDLVPGSHTHVIGNIEDANLVDGLCAQVDAVIHTASFHAPHVGTISTDKFRQTNVSGTEILLKSCLAHRVKRFVYTSTTSLYGDAMLSDHQAVWVTEDLTPIPRDIYDETKIEAENLCAQAAQAGLTCVSLRMSRCFPEPPHVMAVYRLYRGVDKRDVAQAHCLALESDLDGFEVFNVSALSPFKQADLPKLHQNAADVVVRYFPWASEEFSKRNWSLPRTIDRVYVIEKAQKILGYRPTYSFPSMFGRQA